MSVVGKNCGTQATYKSGCSCDACRAAHAAKTAAQRRRNGRKRYAKGGGRYSGEIVHETG